VSGPAEPLPDLPLEGWRPTKDTLHLYAQVLGKVRMASAPPRNHWWHVPLYVGERGLTTRRLTHGGAPGGPSFTLDLDVLEPALVVRTSDGDVTGFPLHDGLSVRDFYRGVMGALDGLGLGTPIRAVPFGVPMTTPFDEDVEHAGFDAAAVRRFWAVLRWADTVLEEFAGWFCGKTSPVHLFWHSFDLALTRFSDRRVPAPPGTDPVSAEAYSHEVVSFGFWAGDDRTPFPAFYSYTAPEPEGLTGHRLAPASARWQTGAAGSLALLHYDDVRTAADPRATLLSFLESAYQAGASAAGWDRADLTSSWCPAPDPTLDPLTLPEVLARRRV
jgi:Family of unknown function (DUF5996)